MTSQKATDICKTHDLYACILIGGKSTRMGQPKHLLQEGGISWLEHTVTTISPFVDRVVLAGAGEIPEQLAHLKRLHDLPGLGGPLAGILAAFRWSPSASFIVLACDMPRVSAQAINWLLLQVKNGVKAVFPCLQDSQQVEPLFAYYGWQCKDLLEDLAKSGKWGLHGLKHKSGIFTPQLPRDLRQAWCNINTPSELKKYRHQTGEEEPCSE